MTYHQETKTVPHSPDQMFDLVTDIMKYPDFLPWVEAIRMRKKNIVDGKGEMIADMIVGYKMFREKFTSHVEIDRSEGRVHAQFLDGPFRKLDNIWVFKVLPNGSTEIDFQIDFEFKNRLLQATAMQFFDKAFLRLSDAFITRADEIYS